MKIHFEPQMNTDKKNLLSKPFDYFSELRQVI